MFQSAPRPHDRGDTFPICGVHLQPGFNPRPGLTTGATDALAFANKVLVVSIRAPASRPGRPYRHGRVRRPRHVSIRAPASRPGRLATMLQPCRRSSFQSAPRPHDRGDRCETRAIKDPRGFNPRPGLTTGATGKLNTSRETGPVSIRAPASRPGRRILARKPTASKAFQSAPRPHDRGDDPFDLFLRAIQQFQSAPRPHDRGDFNMGMMTGWKSSFNPRPGLTTGATRPFPPSLWLQLRFNPRPGLTTGATSSSTSGCTEHAAFQSAPRPHDRGDFRNPAIAAHEGVSIRAPASRPGRHKKAPAVVERIRFQSAPRPHDRGDTP